MYLSLPLHKSAHLHKIALINKDAHVLYDTVKATRRHVDEKVAVHALPACTPTMAQSVVTLTLRQNTPTGTGSLSAFILLKQNLVSMATTKKIKVSDDPVVDNDPGVFQALEQVQQKLDQVRPWEPFVRTVAIHLLMKSIVKHASMRRSQIREVTKSLLWKDDIMRSAVRST